MRLKDIFKRKPTPEDNWKSVEQEREAMAKLYQTLDNDPVYLHMRNEMKRLDQLDDPDEIASVEANIQALGKELAATHNIDMSMIRAMTYRFVAENEGERPVIKLGSNPYKARCKAFMADYIAATEDHPFDRSARYLPDAASIIADEFDSMIHISDIRSLIPGTGGGSKALAFLCQLADKHQVKLSLTAKAYGDDERLSTPQLHAWYARYGFADDEDTFGNDEEGYDMIRYPA
jgi:hypothetical protein